MQKLYLTIIFKDQYDYLHIFNDIFTCKHQNLNNSITRELPCTKLDIVYY
jgi:hypothetical protein